MPFGRAILLGPLVSVVAALVLPSPWLAGASFLLFGAGPMVWTITSMLRGAADAPEAEKIS